MGHLGGFPEALDAFTTTNIYTSLSALDLSADPGDDVVLYLVAALRIAEPRPSPRILHSWSGGKLEAPLCRRFPDRRYRAPALAAARDKGYATLVAFPLGARRGDRIPFPAAAGRLRMEAPAAPTLRVTVTTRARCRARGYW